MNNMIVKNISSKSAALTIGGEYYAKVDGSGTFRVRDNNGRWSKYSPDYFEVISDKDSHMERLGKPTTEYLLSRGESVKEITTTEDKPTTFTTEDTIDIETLLHALESGEITKYDVLKAAGVTEDEPDTSEVIDFKVAKAGDSVQIVKLACDHTPRLNIGDVCVIRSYDKDIHRGVITTKGQLLRDEDKEYVIIAEEVKAKSVNIKKSEKVEETDMKKTRTLRDILVEQGVPDKLVTEMNEFRKQYANNDMPENIKARIPKPVELYDGGELWTMCITAILAGRHILLSGGKATGKNTLTKSLAFAFQRPMWDISFHKNIGKDEIIGSETFRDGNVVFNPGMAYTCAVHGGFGVLDEINMANEGSISVLNSILDDRRVIDVPGYDRIELHPASTFIGTMNYGYSGTRPLNEALASRFVIPNVKELDETGITKLLAKKYPTANVSVLKYFAGAFQDLQTKAHNAEISTASVDLRGIISALAMIEYGLAPSAAMTANVVNKSFEDFERRIVQDVINTRIPKTWVADDVFGSTKSIVVDMSKVKEVR